MQLSLLFEALSAILAASEQNSIRRIRYLQLFTIRISLYLFRLTVPLSLLFDALSAILAASGGVRWSYQPSINTKIAIDPISMACPVIQETWDE